MWDLFYPVMFGFIAAICLLAISFVLKSRGLRETFKKYDLVERPVVSYLAISEIVDRQMLPIRGYLLFRGIPSAAVLLMANAYLNRFLMPPAIGNWVLLISFLIFNFGFTFIGGRRLLPFNSIRITYLLMMGYVTVVGAIVTWVAVFVDITAFAIDLSEIINNLVAAFVSALIVVIYFSSSSMSDKQMSKSENEFEIRELVLRHTEVILHKHGNSIQRVCHKYNLNQDLVVSILTYEDLNRPQSIRKIENLFVRLLKLELTVGIAQVRSRTPINDAESIEKMGEILSNLFRNLQLPTSRYGFVDVLEKYNGSRGYADEVMKIYDVLQESASPSGPVG